MRYAVSKASVTQAINNACVTQAVLIGRVFTCPITMARARTDMEVTVLANFAAQALGYNSLKEHQIEVVLAVAGGRDVFAVLPTGYGRDHIQCR